MHAELLVPIHPGRAIDMRPLKGEPTPSAVEHMRTGALAIIAHDLKGPLANLALLIEALGFENAKAPPDRRTVLTERAERLVLRLEQVLGGLVEHVRLHGDPLVVTADEIDLANLVCAAVANNAPLATKRGVRLSARAAGPLRIRGDAELLLQALDNLVNNAVKYTAPGGEVICEAGQSDEGGLAVRVHDEGPGLTEADFARAFRPFTRLSAVAETSVAHSGLGLWIVRLIAENHGGRIDAVNNRDRRGATFTLHLPQGRP